MSHGPRRRRRRRGAAAERGLHLQLLDLARQPLGLGLQLRDRLDRLVLADVQRWPARCRSVARCAWCSCSAPVAGQRLDAAHARRDAALLGDREEPDVAGRAHVRAAAQLDAEAGNR